MKRTAEVALTAPAQVNVNRLRVPSFGLASLCLGTNTKGSKCHLLDSAPKPKQADKGTDDFHFVPEKEVIKIAYELDDAFGLIDSAKLEIFGRFDDKPLWTLDLTKLGDDWLAHGKHFVKWDGRLVTPTAT